MLLHIVARGKIGRSPEAELVERYMKRIQWPTKLTELPDRGGKMPDPAAQQRTILLDETGRTLNSMEFADMLGGWRDDGVRDLVFLIGGAVGLAEEMRKRADMVLSLGKQTWPHQLVPALLAEQLYRGHAILTGHPYHRV